MNIEKELAHAAFFNREYQLSHLAYEREMAFFQSVQMGDAEAVERLWKPVSYTHLTLPTT